MAKGVQRGKSRRFGTFVARSAHWFTYAGRPRLKSIEIAQQIALDTGIDDSPLIGRSYRVPDRVKTPAELRDDQRTVDYYKEHPMMGRSGWRSKK